MVDFYNIQSHTQSLSLSRLKDAPHRKPGVDPDSPITRDEMLWILTNMAAVLPDRSDPIFGLLRESIYKLLYRQASVQATLTSLGFGFCPTNDE